jgi:prepilin peptidase CpaA
MLAAQNIALAIMFIPLAIMITYMDIRYRRIPNRLVLITLLGGLALNTFFGGMHALVASLGGAALAFGLMFFLHLFGTLGAGDVKLFASIGAIIGISHVLPTLLVIAITGGVLAICKMVYARRVGITMLGVVQFFYGLLPGGKVPRFEIPSDRSHTLPYAVAINFGSLLSFFILRV